MRLNLLNNLDQLRTTPLGIVRIRKNLGLSSDIDVVDWCKKCIVASTDIEKRGKNWYIRIDGVEITVNASSFTIITAHRVRR